MHCCPCRNDDGNVDYYRQLFNIAMAMKQDYEMQMIEMLALGVIHIRTKKDWYIDNDVSRY